MSSLSSIIRAAAAGLAIKPRAEGEDPRDPDALGVLYPVLDEAYQAEARNISLNSSKSR